MNRFWHTGPAAVFAVFNRTPKFLVDNALAPATWLSSAVLLGTCERQPQLAINVVREEVRNDLGGDLVIAEPYVGQKVQIRLELNRFNQVAIERVQAEFSGARTGLTGVSDVLTLSTFPDVLGNSVGILLYYPDVNNRHEEGVFVPMATIKEYQPSKIGNRTAAISIAFSSNTGFSSYNGRCVSFDFVKYPNGTNLDAALSATICDPNS